jgi:hypothetical protein
MIRPGTLSATLPRVCFRPNSDGRCIYQDLCTARRRVRLRVSPFCGTGYGCNSAYSQVVPVTSTSAPVQCQYNPLFAAARGGREYWRNLWQPTARNLRPRLTQVEDPRPEWRRINGSRRTGSSLPDWLPPGPAGEGAVLWVWCGYGQVQMCKPLNQVALAAGLPSSIAKISQAIHLQDMLTRPLPGTIISMSNSGA